MSQYNESGKVLTIGILLDALNKAKDISPYGLDTVICLCEMEREYTMFADAGLDYTKEYPEDGAVFLVSLHPLNKKTSLLKE